MRALLIVMAAMLFLTGTAEAAAGRPLRVLYLDQSAGWKHRPVTRPDGGGPALSELVMDDIGQESGAFVVESTQDAREITPERLGSIDVLVLYTTGALPFSVEAWNAVQARVSAGHLGFVGLHSATDTGWVHSGEGLDYTALIGGRFAGHPWTEDQAVRVRPLDAHPLASAWGAGADLVEEIYQYRAFDPAAVRVIQSLDYAGTPLKRPYAVPVAWVRGVGRGRVFYTTLGHNETTWADARFRRQIVEAVRWTARRSPGAVTPNPLEQARDQVRALLAYAGVEDAEARASAPDDARWLLSVAPRIAALQAVYPGKPGADPGRFEAAYRPLLAEVIAKTER